MPLKDGHAHVEDKDVAVIERRALLFDLLHAHRPLALDLKQSGLVCRRVDLVEATLDATVEVLKAALKVGQEERRLVALHFAVLHGAAAQAVVELDRLVGRDTLSRTFKKKKEWVRALAEIQSVPKTGERGRRRRRRKNCAIIRGVLVHLAMTIRQAKSEDPSSTCWCYSCWSVIKQVHAQVTQTC